MFTNSLEICSSNTSGNWLRKSIATVFCQNQTLGAPGAKSVAAAQRPSAQSDRSWASRSSPKRDTAIDLLKILAIFGVLIMHSCAPFFDGGQNPEMRVWLVCYAMQSFVICCVPVFVMCSGAMLLSGNRDMGPLAFYKNRLPKLITPLIVWSMVYYIYKVDPAHLTLADIPVFLKQFFSGTVVANFWFLYMLIGVYLSAPFLQIFMSKATRSQQWALAILSLGLPSIQLGLKPLLDLNMGLGYSIFSSYVGYFVLGYLLQTAKLPQRGGRLGLLGGYLGVVLITFFSQWSIHSASLQTQFFFLNYPMGNVVVMSAIVFMFVRSFSFVRLAPWSRFIAILANATYGVYLVHLLARFLLKVGILGVPITPTAFHPVLGVALTAVGMFIVSLAMVYILSKIPYLRQSVGYGRSASAK
jgi:surface polysaccharide O-acyltransferase-like enzyme